MKLSNNWRAKAAIKRNDEIMPTVGRPDEPVFRNAADKKSWLALVEQLEQIPGLLTLLDGPQLERYARFLSRWRDLEDHLEKVREGTIAMLLDKDRRQVQRLLWNESRMIDNHLSRIEDAFGLTPVARTKIRLMHNVGSAASASATATTIAIEDKNKKRFFA